MGQVVLALLVLAVLSPPVHDHQVIEDGNVSLARIRRQVLQEPHMQPLLNPPIPTSIGHYLGPDQPIDSCVRDEVLVRGGCHRLLTRGPCAKDEYVLLDPSDLKGFCAPRLCAPDRIFVFSDQMCHDPKNTRLCPPGRHLYQSAYGTPVCQCPDGTYEGDDDLDDDVCDPLLGRTLSCPPNQVLWFRNFRMPPECLPDPCGGENLNRGPNDLPFVPSSTDGKCYQLGQSTGVCPAQTWYSLALETLRGVCMDLEEAGYQVLDEETLAYMTQTYGPPIPRESTAPIPTAQTPLGPAAGAGVGQARGTATGQGLAGQPGATGAPGQPGTGSPGFVGQPGPGSPGFVSQPGAGSPGFVGQPGTGSPGFAGQPGTGSPGFIGQPGAGSPGFVGQPGTTGQGSTTILGQGAASGQGFRGHTGATGHGITTNFGQSGTTTPGQGFRGQTGTSGQEFKGQTGATGQGFTTNFGQGGAAAPGFRGQPGTTTAGGQSFTPQGFAGQGFAGQGFSGQGFAGQGFAGQPFPGQGFQGQSFQGQGFQGQGFQGQGFGNQGVFGQRFPNSTVFTGQVGSTPHGHPTTTTTQGHAPTHGHVGMTSTGPTTTTTIHGQTTTTMIGQTTKATPQGPGAPRGGSHRGHPPHITSRSRPQQPSPAVTQPFPPHVPAPSPGFRHFQPSPHSHTAFHSPHIPQASSVLSPRMPMAPHGAFMPGHSGVILSHEQQSLEMFGMPGMMHPQLGRSMGSHPGFSSNPMAQGDLSVVMGQLLAHRQGLTRNADLSFLQTPTSHPNHGFFNGVKTLMAGVLEGPVHQQQHQQQQPQHHHRARRSPLPHATPGNVFETRLVGCRAGAQRDINAKCRNTILPSAPPVKRNLRAVPPVPPRPGCPTGQAYDRRRRCAAINDAVSSINAFNLGK